jgi:outer membrane lipopolysaccharide assembly protein LptE/RlpB
MRLHTKYLAHLVLVAALLLLTACGNNSPQMVITTQNGITTYWSL